MAKKSANPLDGFSIRELLVEVRGRLGDRAQSGDSASINIVATRAMRRVDEVITMLDQLEPKTAG